jgi:hypothetical protein
MTATNRPEPIFSLPTGRLLLIPPAGCILVGAFWSGGAAVLGAGALEAVGALLAGVAAAVATLLSMLLIGPWRKRSVIRWPFVFLAGTLLQTLLTLAGGFLLYSATPYGTVAMWLCLVVAFWAGLVGLVRIYGSHVRRLAPANGERPVAEETGAETSE